MYSIMSINNAISYVFYNFLKYNMVVISCCWMTSAYQIWFEGNLLEKVVSDVCCLSCVRLFLRIFWRIWQRNFLNPERFLASSASTRRRREMRSPCCGTRKCHWSFFTYESVYYRNGYFQLVYQIERFDVRLPFIWFRIRSIMIQFFSLGELL